MLNVFLARKVRLIFSLFLEDVMTQQYAIDTLLAQAGNRSDERTGAVSAPIFSFYGLWSLWYR